MARKPNAAASRITINHLEPRGAVDRRLVDPVKKTHSCANSSGDAFGAQKQQQQHKSQKQPSPCGHCILEVGLVEYCQRRHLGGDTRLMQHKKKNTK